MPPCRTPLRQTAIIVQLIDNKGIYFLINILRYLCFFRYNTRAMPKGFQTWDLHVPNHFFAGTFGLLSLFIFGCSGHTPTVNQEALNKFKAAQAQLSGPFDGTRTSETSPNPTEPVWAAPQNTDPDPETKNDSTKAAEKPSSGSEPSEDDPSTDPNPKLSQPPEGYLSTRSFLGPAGPVFQNISIHENMSAVLGIDEIRPVIFIPPAKYQVGFIRRGSGDVTLQTYKYEQIGDTFQYCDSVSGQCFKLPSNKSEKRSLELDLNWTGRKVPLVAYRRGTTETPSDTHPLDFILIKHDPNYEGADYANVFDYEDPPLQWKAFLFSKGFKRLDRVYNTADLWFRSTGERDEYQIDIKRFESNTNPGPWKTLRVNVRDELPWKLAQPTKNTKGMEIYLSEKDEKLSMTGKVFYPDGSEVWFIAFPETTLMTLAYAEK